jgi:hypothetical protein
MTHAYHPHCGCDACCVTEEQAERREQCQLAWLDGLTDAEFRELVGASLGCRGYETLTDAVLEATSADYDKAMRRAA